MSVNLAKTFGHRKLSRGWHIAEREADVSKVLRRNPIISKVLRDQHQLFSENGSIFSLRINTVRKGSIFTTNQYCYSAKSQKRPQPVINVIVF